jgi:hypothetical protein
MEGINENTIVKAVVETKKTLSKGKYETIKTAWNNLDNILKGNMSKVNSKIVNTAVDVFQMAGLTLCELKGKQKET